MSKGKWPLSSPGRTYLLFRYLFNNLFPLPIPKSHQSALLPQGPLLEFLKDAPPVQYLHEAISRLLSSPDAALQQKRSSKKSRIGWPSVPTLKEGSSLSGLFGCIHMAGDSISPMLPYLLVYVLYSSFHLTEKPCKATIQCA